MVVHTCNLSIWEAETEEWQVKGQLGLHTKFQASLGYIARPCLQTIQKYVDSYKYFNVRFTVLLEPSGPLKHEKFIFLLLD
jgi:hypothetical protein